MQCTNTRGGMKKNKLMYIYHKLSSLLTNVFLCPLKVNRDKTTTVLGLRRSDLETARKL